MTEWLAGNRIIGTSAERTIPDVLPDVTTDGSYTVLKYKTNGKFIPTSAFNVEYLVVAGGGSGAVNNGGGGAGGYLTNFGGTALGVTAQAYTITVGAGGAGSGYTGNRGNSGGNSVFSTITSTGGGGGGCEASGQIIGGNGGSGGGGGYPSGTAGGSASPSGQGNAGGTSGNQQVGGGGGGSSAVGSNASGYNAGNGGNGTANSISGSSVTYAGGGGGGAGTVSGVGSSGGSGGGGSGSASNGVGGTGTANTGSGGGGSADGSGTSGSGSSGVVILRFLTSGSVYELSSAIPKTSGGWKEVGRTTLGSAGSAIDVSSLPDKRYYMILADLDRSTGLQERITFNGDTGSNYSHRLSTNGGTDATATGQANIMATDAGGSPTFAVAYIANKSDKEKFIMQQEVSAEGTGAGVSLFSYDVVGKWTNTSNAINQITYSGTNYGSARNYDSGAEVVVLGWDDDDTHTTNFWEELASVNGSGSNTLSSGTITAKKYLWLQFYLDPSASYTPKVNFNGDGGSNYTNRYSMNNGTYASDGAESGYYSGFGGGAPQFSNMFIMNNSADEKLAINQMVYQGTSGAGNAPERVDSVGKWTNTSSQITSIDITGGSATLSTSSFMKVWGSN